MNDYMLILYVEKLFKKLIVFRPTTVELVFSFDLLWLFVLSGRAKGIKLL